MIQVSADHHAVVAIGGLTHGQEILSKAQAVDIGPAVNVTPPPSDCLNTDPNFKEFPVRLQGAMSGVIGNGN